MKFARLRTWLGKQAFVFTAAFLFLVIAADGLVSINELSTVIERFRSARDSDNILDALGETLGALRDTEDAQRGYLLTGRAEYQQSYDSSRLNVNRHLTQLQILTSRDAVQRDRIHEF